MGDHPRTPRSPTWDFHSIFRKKTTLKDICKSLVTKKNHHKGFPKNITTEESMTELDDRPKRVSENYYSSPAFLSRTESERSKTPKPSRSLFSKSASRRCKTPTPFSRSASRTYTSEAEASTFRSSSRRHASDTEDSQSKSRSRMCISEPQTPNPAASPSKDVGSRSSSENEPPLASLSRNMSRGSSTPIIFSQSPVRKKPPPVEKKLECTLEDLCFGSVKKIKLKRDVIKQPGIIVQEEEKLKIEVNPGWRKGTKIMFEGKGDEKPGYFPADIVFLIDEKEHPLFCRDGDKLKIGVKIPLVNALTGCSIPVPLIGGETLTLSFENTIIYPGYEKVIKGQGMPNPKNDGRRGDLHIEFLVNFPTELSEKQREEAVSFLQDCS